jgi:hypothetical protein
LEVHRDRRSVWSVLASSVRNHPSGAILGVQARFLAGRTLVGREVCEGS